MPESCSLQVNSKRRQICTELSECFQTHLSNQSSLLSQISQALLSSSMSGDLKQGSFQIEKVNKGQR